MITSKSAKLATMIYDKGKDIENINLKVRYLLFLTNEDYYILNNKEMFYDPIINDNGELRYCCCTEKRVQQIENNIKINAHSFISKKEKRFVLQSIEKYGSKSLNELKNMVAEQVNACPEYIILDLDIMNDKKVLIKR